MANHRNTGAGQQKRVLMTLATTHTTKASNQEKVRVIPMRESAQHTIHTASAVRR